MTINKTSFKIVLDKDCFKRGFLLHKYGIGEKPYKELMGKDSNGK